MRHRRKRLQAIWTRLIFRVMEKYLHFFLMLALELKTKHLQLSLKGKSKHKGKVKYFNSDSLLIARLNKDLNILNLRSLS